MALLANDHWGETAAVKDIWPSAPSSFIALADKSPGANAVSNN
jgi:hypothetical protein